ncbi:prolyl oligopeptidase family serine peptidase [Reyranella sp.]|uniref:prolyl oligopeptidase family serine peptidase n=1 Tax=Reyranella sp. TaxID=1929291 RepID=UPI003D0B65E3
MSIDARPTVDAPDDDPWLWLEDVEGERASAWVGQQNARTLTAFGGPQVEADATTLAAILDRSDKIPFPGRRAGWLYNFWTDAAHPRGLWRRTTAESFRSDVPNWDVLIDLDALATAEGEDWIWGGANTRPIKHDRAMIRLSRGGSDAVVLREFDLETRSFVRNGFVLPEAKGGVSWIDDDTLLLSSAFGGDVTTSGYARTVRLWRRGTKPGDAPVLFEVPAKSMSASGAVDRTDPERPIWFYDAIGFFDFEVWREKVRLDLPTGVQTDIDHGWFLVQPRNAWVVGGKVWPGDCLLGIRLDAFLAGSRDFTLLFEPAKRRILNGHTWNAGRLILSILDNLVPVFEVLTPAADGWTRTTLPGLPSIGVVDVWSLDVERSEANGELLASAQDPLTPSSLMLLEPGKAPTVLKRSPPAFSAEGLVVTRHEAISVDGERIPYVQTGPAGETGNAPVHMTGYGGFGVTTRPYYNSSIGKLWLERGGTSVTANIRGGGEFGVPWHDAGRGVAKRLTHDDFAAVAADLVRRGVTRPGRIAAEGGSNGGILIAKMMTRYPGRFGALLCTIPLIDMRRYSKLLAGASWIAEYGDPDKPEEWAWLQTYSAYHQAVPGQAYPPILFATTRRDDRVHPGHARKMAAKLQAMGYRDAWFYEPPTGGHGYGKDNRERAHFIALGYAFLRDRIGWM